MRRLTPEEALAWRRVAASVRRAQAPAVDPVVESVAKPARKPIARAPVVADAKPAPRVQPKPGSTLDGSWDRKIGTGAVVPDRTIDLHGENLRGAYARLDMGIEAALRDGCRVILLITGNAPRAGTSRLDLPRRGIIRDSVGDWLSVSRHAGAIAAVHNAHPRHGGAGALYLILRRAAERRSSR